jgi:hypothetical protein
MVMRDLQKRKPWRSEKYLAWVRQQDCCYTQRPAHIGGIQAHHINGQNLGKATGDKISDCFAIPLTSQSHVEIHANKDIIDQQRAALLLIERALQEGVLVVAK